ncbi:MAG: T9SS type A sorting domain-containing protein [Bacteroidia bacterium]|nr:T9SS type A sorting domain-containing protein [Bacteroidia bacterium]
MQLTYNILLTAMKNNLFGFLFLSLLCSNLFGQVNRPEQDCVNAIPVCSQIVTVPFSYSGDGLASNEINPSQSCLATGEVNSVWFSVEIQSPGSLEFLLIPNSQFDDYDFALMDLTNASCSDIPTMPGLEVSCNFSINTGITGSTGMNTSLSANNPEIEPGINVLAGEKYVLVVTNFSGSTSGFSLDFSTSTAGIGDSTSLFIDTVSNLVNQNGLLLNLTSPVFCAQLDTGDFNVFDSLGVQIPLLSVQGVSCNAGMTDSIELFLDSAFTVQQLLSMQVQITDSLLTSCNFDSSSLVPVGVNQLGVSINSSRVEREISTCEGDSVLLTTNFSGLPGFKITWFPGGIEADEIRVLADSGMFYTASVTYLSKLILGRSSRSFDFSPAFSLEGFLNDSASCGPSITLSLPNDGSIYVWSTGDSSASTTIDRGQEGKIYVRAINNNGCLAEDSVEVDFLNPPIASFGIEIDSTHTFSFVSVSLDADSLFWRLGDGTTSTDSAFSHTYMVSAGENVFPISLEVYGPCGADTLLDTIRIVSLSNEKRFENNSFYTSMEDGMLLIGSTNEIQNPARLEIWDLQGRRVHETIIRGFPSQTNVSNLPRGVYLLRLYNRQESIMGIRRIIR